MGVVGTEMGMEGWGRGGRGGEKGARGKAGGVDEEMGPTNTKKSN